MVVDVSESVCNVHARRVRGSRTSDVDVDWGELVDGVGWSCRHVVKIVASSMHST
jgi:hypothetical protein